MNSPSNFCVFILTHGRPNNVITYDTLKKCGYKGPLFLVCDNQDKCLDDYRMKFGESMVMVFDKKKEADLCDKGTNTGDLRTVLMARNACFGIAEKLGFKYFMQLDDDYGSFLFRFPVGKKDAGRNIKNINKVFALMLDFYIKSNATSISMAQGGDFIGGCLAPTGAYRFSKRKVMNSFICSTERPFRFVGALNDDVNTYVTLGSVGHLFITIPCLQLNQKQTQQQAGGLTDIYKRFGTYVKSFTTVMMAPSSTKVSMMNANDKRIHHAIIWPKAVPVIIPSRFKK